MGIGSHTRPNKGDNDLWLTPPSIMAMLGTFDLDPCACPEPRPWITARKHIALPADGLAAQWEGRVWCNPPYGDETGQWMERMARHGRGTALVFARTETEFWHSWIWPHAHSILFLKGRLYFHYPDGTRAAANAGGPSALIAYGEADTGILAHSGIAGRLVRDFCKSA